MGGFVPQGPGVTHEDRIFEEPDVSHGKHLLDRVSTIILKAVAFSTKEFTKEALHRSECMR